MKIIIEEYQYAVEDVKDILWEGAFQTVDGKVSINYVGYYFNPRQGVNDCVFILPKVLLEVGSDKVERVFGKYLPKDIVITDEPDKDVFYIGDSKYYNLVNARGKRTRLNRRLKTNELHLPTWFLDDLKEANVGIDIRTQKYAVIDCIIHCPCHAAVRVGGSARLAPGDFRTVRQSLYYLGDAVNNAMLLGELEKESRIKSCPDRTKIGVLYADGLGVEADEEKAVYWYMKSADNGDMTAKGNLGVCLVEGFGMKCCYRKAAELLRAYLEQSPYSAKHHRLLAECYEHGVGGRNGRRLALYHYQEAADFGSKKAREGIRRLESTT